MFLPDLLYDPLDKRTVHVNLVRLVASGTVHFIVCLAAFRGIFRESSSISIADTGSASEFIHDGRRRTIDGGSDGSKRVPQLLEDLNTATIFKF